MKPTRWGIALGLAGGVCSTAWAAAPRAKSLAQFDAGYAQCEKKHPEMRGRGDLAYASLYRLKLDDSMRASLAQSRGSALYKTEHRRAAQKLSKSVAASDVAERLELQCQALQREIAKSGANSKP